MYIGFNGVIFHGCDQRYRMESWWEKATPQIKILPYIWKLCGSGRWFPAIGYMPYVSSTGVIAMTRVASTLLIWLFVCNGIRAFAPVGAFSLPCLRHGVCCTLVIFSLILVRDSKNFSDSTGKPGEFRHRNFNNDRRGGYVSSQYSFFRYASIAEIHPFEWISRWGTGCNFS